MQNSYTKIVLYITFSKNNYTIMNNNYNNTLIFLIYYK